MNFLLEIGVEELPAEYARRAWFELSRSKVLAEALGGAQFIHLAGLEYGLYTPRRLALVAGGFPARHPDLSVKISGPARKAAFDADGKPTRALEGFLKGQGLTPDQIHFESTPKGEYVAAQVVRKGAEVRAALEKAIPEAISALTFPKTMRWERSGVRFARPVRWIVALLDGHVLDVKFADVTAGNRSCGHRFFHPGFFQLDLPGHAGSPADLLQAYLGVMADRGVMVGGGRRRRRIRADLARQCSALGGRLVEDEELVDITSDLVEWPAVVRGNFDPAYLALPAEVIITAMREHQRYFAARGEGGRLLPNFLCVANASESYFEACARAESAAGMARGLRLFMEASEPGAEIDRQPDLTDFGDADPALDAALEPIARGNERVLRARLDDAKFYWDTDLARWKAASGNAPEVQAEPLRGVAWLEGWGSVYEKAGRVARLVRELGPEFRLEPAQVKCLERAAWLMKLDLTADMIKDGKEFTSLEGRMGALYAASCGEPVEITGPMAEHHLPRASVTEREDRDYLARERGDGGSTLLKLPSTHPARVLALLEKLDSLAGFFAAGRIPTGSEDPFGVRRIGNGVVALLLQIDRLDRALFLSRGAADERWADRPVLRRSHIEAAIRGHGSSVAADAADGVRDQIFDFLITRLRAFLADESTEAVNAALAAGSCRDRRAFYPADAARRARHMTALLEGEGSERAREDLFGLSILFKRVSNILKDSKIDGTVSVVEQLEPPEQKLHEAVEAARQRVLQFGEAQAHDRVLSELLVLRAPIDQFFVDVMVMAEDPEVRDRRLRLLDRVRRLLLEGWDFSQVSVPATVS